MKSLHTSEKTTAEVDGDRRAELVAFVASLTRRPGVYRMIDGDDEVLYVGKAKDLRRRVASYFNRPQVRRIQLMVAQVCRIEITVTHTEAEALILENTLIKAHQPRYNVLLKDDKSYPYIHLSDGPFPRLEFYRGTPRGGGRFFGPYPSAGSIRETLRLLQKLFPVRQCEEAFFRNRTRPCLQYQIRRCSGPCVGLVEAEEYAAQVADAVLFLEGKTNEVIDVLVARMEQAAGALDFERAARFRDQIAALRRLQERQYVSGERGDLDIVAMADKAGQVCVQVFFIRAGRNLGNKVFFPRVPADEERAQVMAAFLAQYYLEKRVPGEVVTNLAPAERELLEATFCERMGHRVRIKSRVRAERARWLALAEKNAVIALDSRLAQRGDMLRRFDALREALDLDEPPRRIECFDISHTGGNETVAACVVFDQQGPLKADYRRFNIRSVTPGDDYGALREAVARRYGRIVRGEGKAPDILFIDGGKGQIGGVAEVLQELGCGDLMLVGIAKGRDRKPGMERLFLSGQGGATILPPDSPALHLVQHLRDEAHRFAITGHRQRRQKAGSASLLEQIPGVGPKRRQRLIRQFGGLQELARAGVDDLARVDGISRTLAREIYRAFHGDG